MSVTDVCFKEVALYNKDLGKEIGWRMCSGRAYYSMYHKTVKALSHYTYAGTGTHQDLIEYLKNDASRLEKKDAFGCKRVAYMLNQAKSERKLADYDIDKDFNESLAVASLKMVAKYSELIDDIFK
ncbi:hypothetical protein [Shewanella sp. Isolate7]|uniref:hypothetical protein n=1 Tax=Shewanella sp. Isolate7 TaxID=2908528 RepID=UPI001EFEE4F7|nr:hypothetical protein [Shewanella sp. Isolate7]MCG9721756.1 hypothetical protein [Shewanella sp. Isolate7]